MTSFVNMSLEDIIQRKRSIPKGTPNTNKPKSKWDPPKLKNPIIDAREKIISRKRAHITDARDKLVELAKHKDARCKLDLLRKKRALKDPGHGRNNIPHVQLMRATKRHMDRAFIDTSRQVVSQPTSRSRLSARQQINTKKFLENRAIDTRPFAFVDTSRQVVSQPKSRSRLSERNQINTKKFLENRSIDSRAFVKAPKMKPILRTVVNDLDIIDDTMEEDYVPPKPSSQNRKTNLQLRIIAHNNNIQENRSSHRLSTPEKDNSPPRPPSILKKRPKAVLRTEKKTDTSETTDKPVLEYRIIVSNLRNTVTGGDIEELFGDVGGMLESRLVRPGTAEVIYKSVESAQKAVELYHNRQLDGQPMNCLLVTPRSNTAAPIRNASKPALYSTNSNVEPDISTFHKVLFSNF